METTVDFGPLLQEAIKVAALLLSALAIWIGFTIKTWIGTKIDLSKTQVDDQLLAQYNSAVLKGISFAETALGQKASGVKIDTKDGGQFIKVAAEYVMKGWPDLMKHYGLAEARVEETVVARLPSETTKRSDALAEAAAGEPKP